MQIKLPFEKGDFKLLRTALIVLVVCISISTALFFGVNQINDSASSALNSARSQYEQVSASVQLISEEEATIIRYIDRYLRFVENGYVEDEDRLALIEDISRIRDTHNLFPVSIDIGEQVHYSLVYDPMDLNPGEPVDLDYSDIELNFSLLHEEDLTRLVSSLLDIEGLLLPTHCQMMHDNINEANFTSFFEHLSSSCSFYWYTFNLNPPEPVYDEY